MFKSLHHVPVPLMDQALAEIRRVLKPGGLAYISEPVFAGEFNEVLRLFHDESIVRREAFSAIERAVAYVEAGADMVFPEAMKSLEDYRKVKAAVKVPILANLTEFGSTPFFTTDDLRGAGVDIALYCCGAYRAMNKAALHFYETVRRDGTQKNIIDTLQTRAELYDFLGYHAYEDKLDALFAK
jgi:2-methylisocitrate lyase-like PEP mutase family enzyme